MKIFSILFQGTTQCKVTISAANEREAIKRAMSIALKKGIRVGTELCSIAEVNNG